MTFNYRCLQLRESSQEFNIILIVFHYLGLISFGMHLNRVNGTKSNKLLKFYRFNEAEITLHAMYKQ